VSEKDKEENKRGRRAAVVILGSLAAGAVLSGGAASTAAAAAPGNSIREQFDSAFVAGYARVNEPNTIQIVLGD
jgi:hypothetical protein